jgi:hypothetical protein
MSKEYLLDITNDDNKIIVNKDNYNHLKDYNFYLENTIIKFDKNNKTYILKDYIWNILFKRAILENDEIIYINNNYYDNRITNLKYKSDKIIQLKNNNKIIVSNEDYKELYNIKWYKNKDYAIATINNINWKMHRYIMIEILKNNIDDKTIIDHIDGNKLNNCRYNLRISDTIQNARNKDKANNTSSNYYGVYWHTSYKKWLVRVNIEGKDINAFYENEIHAAYQYDLWIQNYNLYDKGYRLNNIDKPEKFIEYTKKAKINNLPTNITMKNNKYAVVYKKKTYGIFNNLEEAINKLELVKIQYLEEINEQILNTPITKNDNNEVIINLYNKKKEKIAETIIDEDMYHSVIKYTWCLNGKEHVQSKINGKTIRLHRFILNYDGALNVIHRNGNILDNRRNNLYIAADKEKGQNKSKIKECSSEYIGVCYHINYKKWQADIKINSEKKYIGMFDTEEEAARARDEYTKKYFPNLGKINFDE